MYGHGALCLYGTSSAFPNIDIVSYLGILGVIKKYAQFPNFMSYVFSIFAFIWLGWYKCPYVGNISICCFGTLLRALDLQTKWNKIALRGVLKIPGAGKYLSIQ